VRSIVVFGKSACPFCTEVERTLNAGVGKGGWAYYRLDQLSNGAALHEELKSKTQQRTVPYIFLGGELQGGCSELKRGVYNGSLVNLLPPFPPQEAVAAHEDAPDRCACC